MNQTDIIAIKKIMNYTDSPTVKCQNCNHCGESEEDEMRYFTCSFSNHGMMSVSKEGRCNHFDEVK